MIRYTSGAIGILTILSVICLMFVAFGLVLWHSPAVWVTAAVTIPVIFLTHAIFGWEWEDNETI